MHSLVIEGYEQAAAELVPRYDAVSSADVFSTVADVLPEPASTVIDIGAGTGRDAAWLASRGCRVLAVEPVAAFRTAGARRHRSRRIEWLDDALPELARVLDRGEMFDFMVRSAVWQHLNDQQRQIALPNLRVLATPQGCLLLSVRHGPGAPTRPCFPASVEDTIALAHANDFRLLFRRSAASTQEINRQAGISWTWLAFLAQ